MQAQKRPFEYNPYSRKYHKLSGYNKHKFVDDIKKSQSGDSRGKRMLVQKLIVNDNCRDYIYSFTFQIIVFINYNCYL